jgi:hypothetical protein
MKRLKQITGLLLVVACIVFTLQARANMSADHDIYLPIIVKPLPPPLVVADFDSCDGINNLGGEMGAAYDPAAPDRLIEAYVPVEGRGCVVRLEYAIPTGWSAFWLKLLEADLRPYNRLSFDVKFEGQIDAGTDMAIKVELKRGCHSQGCDEVWIQYVPDITTAWQKRTINLADFASVIDQAPPPPLTAVEELVFTFENGRISHSGTVYLDNIILEP